MGVLKRREREQRVVGRQGVVGGDTHRRDRQRAPLTAVRNVVEPTRGVGVVAPSVSEELLSQGAGAGVARETIHAQGGVRRERKVGQPVARLTHAAVEQVALQGAQGA